MASSAFRNKSLLVQTGSATAMGMSAFKVFFLQLSETCSKALSDRREIGGELCKIHEITKCLMQHLAHCACLMSGNR
jgi:hypothetical protein